MMWITLILLAVPQATVEEKGAFKLFYFGKPAGTETYRMETFEGGNTVLFSKAQFTVEVRGEASAYVFDTVLTADRDLIPVRYAGYHKAGREERQAKLEWKRGLVVSKGRKKVRSASSLVLDHHVIAHYLPLFRRYKGGEARFKAFSPARLKDIDVVVREGERRSGFREIKLRVGTLDKTAWLDKDGALLRLECSALGLRVVREGAEGFVPEALPKESTVRIPCGESGIEAAVVVPGGKGPFPSVIFLAEGAEGAWCGASATGPEFGKAAADALAGAGILVVRLDPKGRLSDRAEGAKAAAEWLRSRDDAAAVALVGHGEGAVAAAMAAAGDAEVRALVLLAPPTRTYEQTLLGRMESELRGQNTPAEVLEEILKRQRRTLAAIRESADDHVVIDERRTFVGPLRERLGVDLERTLAEVKGEVASIHGARDACAGTGIRLEGLGHSLGDGIDQAFLERLTTTVLQSLERPR